MLFQFMDYFKKKNDLTKDQLAIVVKNDDPKKNGRVKVRIKNVLEDSNIDKLPWVYPKIAINQFGKKSIYPPRLESKLIVQFEDGDINFPYYTGYWQDKSNSLSNTESDFDSLFKNNYPNVYGWQDEKGNYELHDLKDEFIQKQYFGKVLFKIDKQGNITLDQIKTLIIEVVEKYHLNSNNILLGTGTTGHKSLVTEDHLTGKYNTFLQALIPLYTTLASASIDPATVAFANALLTQLPNFIDLVNKTSQTKAK